MNFAFDEEQTSLADTVARLLADHPGLLAPEVQAENQVAAWDALAELGLFALLVPERWGGASLSLIDIALAVEALGAGLAPPLAVSTLIATDILVRFGTIEQQQAWLPEIAMGKTKIAVAALEANQGYDPADAGSTFASGKLDGSKILVPQAGAADALLVLVSTRTGPGLILVKCDATGVDLRSHEDIDPSSGFCEVNFRSVAVTGDFVIGHSSPQAAVSWLIDLGATLYAGLQVGISARMLHIAVEYAKTRMQFGQPIGAFQSIKHRCADMAVGLEAARSAAYYAFWAMAEGVPDRTRVASMAKSYCGEVSRSICNETIQVHGGMGFTWELGLHRFLRRARVLEHAFGDGAWHNERVLSETMAQLLGKGHDELAVAAQ